MIPNFQLTILGSNSAMPAYGRFPTSQVLTFQDSHILIDCGEGTQMRLSQYKLKKSKITNIFISHMHGDHLFGLPGLITSMNLNSRDKSLNIYGPIGIKKYLNTVFELSYSQLRFDLNINELPYNKVLTIDINEGLSVKVFPVYHRVPTNGFLFEEKMVERNILKTSIKTYDLDYNQIRAIKAGEDLKFKGSLIPNSKLTKPTHSPVSYAYCADSKFDERIVEHVKNSSVMYFETTYLSDFEDQAIERGHATAKQAAELAKLANVDALITGHYSSRYKDVSVFAEEAGRYFKKVILGYDGLILNLRNL